MICRKDGGQVRSGKGRVWHLGKQAAASRCRGARTGLLKISTCLGQPCALSCLDMADGDAALLTMSGCNRISWVIPGSMCLCEGVGWLSRGIGLGMLSPCVRIKSYELLSDAAHRRVRACMSGSQAP